MCVKACGPNMRRRRKSFVTRARDEWRKTVRRMTTEHRFSDTLAILDEEPTVMVGAGGANRGQDTPGLI